MYKLEFDIQKQFGYVNVFYKSLNYTLAEVVIVKYHIYKL